MLSKTYPMVLEFLSSAVWEDGTSRELGSIVLFMQDGLLKACLKDKGVGAVCFLSGNSLSSLLKACEKALASGGGDWRADRPPKGGKGR